MCRMVHHEHLTYTHAWNGYQKQTRRSWNGGKKIVIQVMRSALEEAIFEKKKKRSQTRIQHVNQIDVRRWKGENINWIITTARWGRRQLRWLQSIYVLVVKPHVTTLKPCTGWCVLFFCLSLFHFIIFFTAAHYYLYYILLILFQLCVFFCFQVVFLNINFWFDSFGI